MIVNVVVNRNDIVMVKIGHFLVKFYEPVLTKTYIYIVNSLAGPDLRGANWAVAQGPPQKI